MVGINVGDTALMDVPDGAISAGMDRAWSPPDDFVDE